VSFLTRNSAIFIAFWVSLAFNVTHASFDEGVKAFDEKEYTQAIQKFEEIIAETPNDVAAYYNLGLSQMANENYGEALWAFEKVLKFKPNDTEAKNYSELCFIEVNQGEEWTPIVGDFLGSVYSLTSDLWSVIAISCSVLLCLIIIVFKKIQSISFKRLFFLSGIFLTFFLFASILAAYGAKKYNEDTSYVIVTDKEIPTYENVDELGNKMLPEGTRLLILDKNYSVLLPVQLYPGEEYNVKPEDVAFI